MIFFDILHDKQNIRKIFCKNFILIIFYEKNGKTNIIFSFLQYFPKTKQLLMEVFNLILKIFLMLYLHKSKQRSKKKQKRMNKGNVGMAQYVF